MSDEFFERAGQTSIGTSIGVPITSRKKESFHVRSRFWKREKIYMV